MAMCIVQGSSGAPYLSPPVYDYICGKDPLSLVITLQDVPLRAVRDLLSKGTS